MVFAAGKRPLVLGRDCEPSISGERKPWRSRYPHLGTFPDGWQAV